MNLVKPNGIYLCAFELRSGEQVLGGENKMNKRVESVWATFRKLRSTRSDSCSILEQKWTVRYPHSLDEGTDMDASWVNQDREVSESLVNLFRELMRPMTRLVRYEADDK